MVRWFRVVGASLCSLLIFFTAGCSDGTEPGTSPQSTASAPAPASTPTVGDPGARADPTGTETAAPTSSARPTTKNQPVPKVDRTDDPKAPTVKAKPTSIDGTVEYSDGVALQILGIDFGKEKDKGPGAFPGRAYAVLTLEVVNDSDRALSMQTVVITVLDKSDKPVAPVYVARAKVQDFSGSLKPGEKAKARYAFAVPKSSRSKVTVVVDFDGVHTSAVFRGKLS